MHSAESFFQEAEEYDLNTPEGCVVEEYTTTTARVLAVVMFHVLNKVETCDQFLQTYSLKRGIREFGDRGTEAAFKEVNQLHDRVVFQPLMIRNLSAIERKRSMESLIFLVDN